VEVRGPADLAWRGHLDGDPERSVILTLKNGYVVGVVFTPDGLYQLTTLNDGGQVLVRLDPARFPDCAGGVQPSGVDLLERRPAGLSLPSVHEEAGAADGPGRIDLLSLYTPQARAAAGGDAAITATIQSAVDVANAAFEASDMQARFFLVHTALANRQDSGNLSSDLGWLVSDPGVAALRDSQAADLVSLIVENGGGYCGLGYVMRNPGPGFASSAFQVTVRYCAVGNLSFAHEHGHNLGFEHNPENSGAWPNSGSYPWSYAHYVPGQFRTVMSYSNPCGGLGCTRVPRFSNPAVLYGGQPTGISNQRDNHRTGDLTAPIVADFRAGSGLFSDGFESGDLSAWSASVP
jgi:hypothetical protein